MLFPGCCILEIVLPMNNTDFNNPLVLGPKIDSESRYVFRVLRIHWHEMQKQFIFEETMNHEIIKKIKCLVSEEKFIFFGR